MLYYAYKFVKKENMIIEILNYLGYMATIIILIQVIIGIYLWFKGIIPVLWRLGNGLAKRKICIFAKNNNQQSFSSLLADSGLFNEKNITNITKEDDFDKSQDCTLYLVYWPDWKNEIIKISSLKKDKEALVIYAPRLHGLIPEDVMSELDKKRNVTVVNFRGRLLNDIVTAMITTGYEKR